MKRVFLDTNILIGIACGEMPCAILFCALFHCGIKNNLRKIQQKYAKSCPKKKYLDKYLEVSE